MMAQARRWLNNEQRKEDNGGITWQGFKELFAWTKAAATATTEPSLMSRLSAEAEQAKERFYAELENARKDQDRRHGVRDWWARAPSLFERTGVKRDKGWAVRDGRFQYGLSGSLHPLKQTKNGRPFKKCLIRFRSLICCNDLRKNGTYPLDQASSSSAAPSAYGFSAVWPTRLAERPDLHPYHRRHCLDPSVEQELGCWKPCCRLERVRKKEHG